MPFRKTKRLISFIASICFLSTEIAWANPQIAAANLLSRPNESGLLPQVHIPPELGRVDGVYYPDAPDAPFILHLQTIHTNYETAKKIRDLIAFLQREYKAEKILVEGGAGNLRRELLDFFEDPSANMRMLDGLAQKGMATGVDLAVSELPIEAVGIEEPEFYSEAFQIFRKVIGGIDKSLAIIQGFYGELDREASKIFSKDLNLLVKEWRRFQADRKDFSAAIKYLRQESRFALGLDFEDPFTQFEWPQLTRLVHLQELETRLDRERFESEREKLKEWLNQNKIPSEFIQMLESPVIAGGAKQKNRIVSGASPPRDDGSVRSAFENFLRRSHPKGFRFADYPQSTYQAAFRVLEDELDTKKLFEEIEKLFDKLLDAKAADKGKPYLDKYRELVLLEKLLRLELNRSEWQKIRFNLAAISEYAAQIPLHQEAVQFYEFSEKREAAFFQNIQLALRSSKKKVAILVTGGFHTENIEERFREGKVGYATITPKITGGMDSSIYHKIMLGRANLEKPEMIQLAGTGTLTDLPYVDAERMTVEAVFAENMRNTSFASSAARVPFYFADRRRFLNMHAAPSRRAEMRRETSPPADVVGVLTKYVMKRLSKLVSDEETRVIKIHERNGKIVHGVKSPSIEEISVFAGTLASLALKAEKGPGEAFLFVLAALKKISLSSKKREVPGVNSHYEVDFDDYGRAEQFLAWDEPPRTIMEFSLETGEAVNDAREMIADRPKFEKQLAAFSFLEHLPPKRSSGPFYRILCLCKGNRARSPLMEFFLKKFLNEHGLNGAFIVTSAGTSPWIGESYDGKDEWDRLPEIRSNLEDAIRSLGLRDEFATQWVSGFYRTFADTKNIMAQADLVLVPDNAVIYGGIESKNKGESPPVHLLSEFLPPDDEMFRFEIPDSDQMSAVSHPLYRLFKQAIASHLGKAIEETAAQTRSEVREDLEALVKELRGSKLKKALYSFLERHAEHDFVGSHQEKIDLFTDDILREIARVIQYLRQMLPGGDKRELVDLLGALRSSNLFHPHRRKKKLPPTFLLDPKKTLSHLGGDRLPRLLALTSDPDFVGAATIYTTADNQEDAEKEPLLARASLSWYREGSAAYPIVPKEARIKFEEKLSGVPNLNVSSVLEESLRAAKAARDLNPFWDVSFDGGSAVLLARERPDLEEGAYRKQTFEKWAASAATAKLLLDQLIVSRGVNVYPPDMKVIEDAALRVQKDLAAERRALAATGEEAFLKSTAGAVDLAWRAKAVGAVENLRAFTQDEEVMSRLGLRGRAKLRVAIQGFGYLAAEIIEYLKDLRESGEALNFEIVGVSGVYGGVYKPAGISIEELVRLRDQYRKATAAHEELNVREAYRKLTGSPALPLGPINDFFRENFEADIVIATSPAAPIIPEENLAAMKERGVKILLQAGADPRDVGGAEVTALENPASAFLYLPYRLVGGGDVYAASEEYFHFPALQQMTQKEFEDLSSHVIDGVRELALTNAQWMLQQLRNGNLGKSPSAILEETILKILKIRAKLLDDPPVMVEQRAELDFHRGARRTFALKTAATESAREQVIYADDNVFALRMDLNYDVRGKRGRERKRLIARQRRAAYIMGKLRKRDAAPDLVGVLSDRKQDPQVRANAAEALGNIGDWVAARDVLEQSAGDLKEHPKVRLWANWALRKLAAIERVGIVTKKTPRVDISDDELDPETGEVMRGYEEMSRKVAKRILEVVNEKKKTGKPALVILPTGSTPKGLYKALRVMAEEGEVDFSGVILFHLDEYVFDQDRFYDPAGKLKPEFQEQTYKNFMETHVVNPLKNTAGLRRFHTPLEHPEVLRRKSGEPEADYQKRAQRVADDYETQLTAAIKEAGGIDLVVLGIGGGHMEGGAIEGGHLAFNESGDESGHDSSTRIVELSSKTRLDAQGAFGGLHATPHYAVTVGLKRILEAKEILMLGSGEDKAAVVEEALKGEISSNFPASFLQLHHHAVYYLDHDAAVALPELTKPWLFPGINPKNRDWKDPRLVSKAVYSLLAAHHKTLGQLQRSDFVRNGFDDLLRHYGGKIALREIKTIAKKRVARHLHNPKQGQDLLPSNSTIVFFSPHPDDDVLTSGITLQHLVEQDRGNNVHIAYLVAGHGSVWSPVLSPKGGLADLKERYGAEWKRYHKGELLPDDDTFQTEFNGLTAIPIMKSLLERGELPEDLQEDLKKRGLEQAWQNFKDRNISADAVTSWDYEDLEQQIKANGDKDWENQVNAVVRLWIYARTQKREEEAREATEILGVHADNLEFFRLGYYSYRAKVHTGRKYQEPDYAKVLDWLRGLHRQAPDKEIHIFYSHEIDPHGAHGIGAEIIERAMRELAKEGIRVIPWWYRGAYEEFPLEEDGSNVVVPASPQFFEDKKKSIWAHASQRVAMFPGLDRRQREFWERVFDRNERTGRLLDALEILDWAPVAAEVFSRQRPVAHPQTPALKPRSEVRHIDFSRRNFVELLYLLDRNLWIIQGRFSPDGIHHYDYYDKSALQFNGDEPDADAIWGLHPIDFDRVKNIVRDIIRDRLRLGKIADMRTHHPGDEMRMKLLTKQLGIPVGGLRDFHENHVGPRGGEFTLEEREKLVLTYLAQTVNLLSSLKEERELVAEMLLDQNPETRAAGISVLKFLPNDIIESILDLALADPSPAVQKAVFEVIRDRGLNKYKPFLLATLYRGHTERPKTPERETYRTAMEALGILAAEDPQLYELLLERFEWTLDPNLLSAFYAGKVYNEKLYRLLLRLLGDAREKRADPAYHWKVRYHVSPLFRIRIAATLRRLGLRTQEAIDVLLPLLKSDEDELLASAVHALGDIAKDNEKVNRIIADLWQNFPHVTPDDDNKPKKTPMALAITKLKLGIVLPGELSRLLHLASYAGSLYDEGDGYRTEEKAGNLAAFFEDHPGKIETSHALLKEFDDYRASYGFWNIDILRALPDLPFPVREEIVNRVVEDWEAKLGVPEKSFGYPDIFHLGQAGVFNEKVLAFLQKLYSQFYGVSKYDSEIVSEILTALAKAGRIEGSFYEDLVETFRIGKRPQNILKAIRLYLVSRFREKSAEIQAALAKPADSEQITEKSDAGDKELESIRLRKQGVYPLDRSRLEASDHLAIFAILPLEKGRIDFVSSPHTTEESEWVASHAPPYEWLSERTIEHQVGEQRHLRGTLENRTSAPEGFLLLDPPKSRPEFLAALGFSPEAADSVYERVLADKFIEVIRILSVPGGIHPEKPLRIRDSVRQIFQRRGYNLPVDFTVHSFLQIVSTPPSPVSPSAESNGVEIRGGRKGTAQWAYEDEKELTSVTGAVGLESGLHVSPVNEIVSRISSPRYDSLSVSITKGALPEKTADARRAVELLGLLTEKGDVVMVTAHGGTPDLRRNALTEILTVIAPGRELTFQSGFRSEARYAPKDSEDSAFMEKAVDNLGIRIRGIDLPITLTHDMVLIAERFPAYGDPYTLVGAIGSLGIHHPVGDHSAYRNFLWSVIGESLFGGIDTAKILEQSRALMNPANDGAIWNRQRRSQDRKSQPLMLVVDLKTLDERDVEGIRARLDRLPRGSIVIGFEDVKRKSPFDIGRLMRSERRYVRVTYQDRIPYQSLKDVIRKRSKEYGISSDHVGLLLSDLQLLKYEEEDASISALGVVFEFSPDRHDGRYRISKGLSAAVLGEVLEATALDREIRERLLAQGKASGFLDSAGGAFSFNIGNLIDFRTAQIFSASA